MIAEYVRGMARLATQMLIPTISLPPVANEPNPKKPVQPKTYPKNYLVLEVEDKTDEEWQAFLDRQKEQARKIDEVLKRMEKEDREKETSGS